MSNKEKELLENFTKKMVKETTLEKPSINFSKNVMDTINKLETENKMGAYQPLISKKVWFIIISFLIASTILLLKTTPIKTPDFLSKFYIGRISNPISFELSFNASNITIYGFVFLAIMAVVQFGYIRNYYNK